MKEIIHSKKPGVIRTLKEEINEMSGCIVCLNAELNTLKDQFSLLRFSLLKEEIKRVKASVEGEKRLTILLANTDSMRDKINEIEKLVKGAE